MNYSGIKEGIVKKGEKVDDQQRNYVWDGGGYQQQQLMLRRP